MNEEYLRRNLVVCKAVGMQANARAALARLCAANRQPRWLLELLAGIIERGDDVRKELAAHRDEIAIEQGAQ